jgi:hypothetical protein
MIKKFDKKSLELMRTEIQEALNKIKKKHDLDVLKIGGITYESDGSGFTTRITAKTAGGNKSNFERVCSVYKLSPENYMETFEYRGDQYIVTGINTRAKKMPIQCRKVGTEETYKFPENLVFNLLSAKV